jgi:hypothetical protein
MKTILKITAGILLAGTIAIVGVVALVGAGASSAAKEQDAQAASPAQVQRVKHGMKRSQVHRLLAPAKPHLVSDSSTEGLGTSAAETFDVKDGGKLFGKSVTVFYSNGRVIDITSTDLGA